MNAASRLAMEFVLIDSGSNVAKRLSQVLDGMGDAGKLAAKNLQQMTDHWNAGLKSLATARALRESLVDPGLAAAGRLQEALSSLEVNLDRASAAETRRMLDELARDAARVAGPTKFSQEDIIGVQTELFKAGLGREAIVGKGGAAEAVAQLATAEGSQMTAGQALDAILALGGTFRLTGDQFATAADEMERVSGASNIGPMEIQEALKMVTGAAKLDRREVLAALGAAGTGGLKGSMAGTAMDAFLLMAAKNNKKLKLFDARGELRPLTDVAQRLRDAFGGMSAQKRTVALNRAFGDQGGRFAQSLMLTGNGSIEDILSKMDGARGLGERVDVMSRGFNAQNEALGGTLTTLMSTLFTPVLDPLGKAAATLNDGASKLNDFFQQSPNAAKAVSYGAVGVTGAAGLYGLFRLLQSGKSLASVIGSVGKLGGVGAVGVGIAEGKAIEAATGVPSVFVVNWPAGLNTAGAAVDAAIGARAAGVAAGEGVSLLGLAVRALPVAIAAAVGYQAGTYIYDNAVKDTSFDTGLQTYFALAEQYSLLRLFNSKEDLAGYKKTSDAGLRDLGLTVSVKVDRDGNAVVDAKDDKGAMIRAAARSGVN